MQILEKYYLSNFIWLCCDKLLCYHNYVNNSIYFFLLLRLSCLIVLLKLCKYLRTKRNVKIMLIIFPFILQGLAFNIEERQVLGIHGLLPAVVKSEDQQVAHCHLLLDRLENELDKYNYLIGLFDRNERLFFRLLSSDIGKMMPIVYTPTVGLACQKYSLIFQQPKGMFITINDRGNVYNVLKVI